MTAFPSYQSYHPHLLVDSDATASSCFPHSSINPPNAPEHRSRCSSLAGVILGEAQQMTNRALVPDVPAAEAKRKNKDCTNSDSPQLKVAERSSRKQRKLDEGDQAATGYVHVRARRGQATDSHSLAERARRAKIRERMNLLQGLVPGCDKITGKALMLDEIINYVQSLQNQVQFLSMKLASMKPLQLYNSGLDLEGHMNQAEMQKLVSMPQEALPIQPVLQSCPIQHKTEEEALGNYPGMETPSPLLLHGQGAIALSQDNGSFLMQVADKRQELLNQVVFHNMCSFQ